MKQGCFKHFALKYQTCPEAQNESHGQFGHVELSVLNGYLRTKCSCIMTVRLTD